MEKYGILEGRQIEIKKELSTLKAMKKTDSVRQRIKMLNKLYAKIKEWREELCV